jgi:hypothetical protein
MSSDTAPSGTVTYSKGAYSGTAWWQLFDSDASTWSRATDTGIGDITYESPVYTTVNQYTLITPANPGGFATALASWIINASSNGSSWTQIDYKYNAGELAWSSTNTYSLANTVAYKYFKLDYYTSRGTLSELILSSSSATTNSNPVVTVISNLVITGSLTIGTNVFSGGGINGTNGLNGVDGTNGVNGINGTNGLNGVDGTNGVNAAGALTNHFIGDVVFSNNVTAGGNLEAKGVSYANQSFYARKSSVELGCSVGPVFTGFRNYNQGSDNLPSAWFQVGGDYDPIVFSSHYGYQAARVVFVANQLQVSAGSSYSYDPPLGVFDVSFENTKLFNVLTNGDVTVAGALTIGTNVLTIPPGGFAPAFVNPPDATNWGWTSDGASITLTNYTGPTDVVIPELLDGLPVTGLGVVFSSVYGENPMGESITSITGGSLIKEIPNFSFYFCTNLTNISFPAATSIGYAAFSTCTKLTDVSFPAVISIGISAFNSCEMLTTISFPVATSVGEGAFTLCNIETLTIDNFPVLTSCGPSAFSECGNLKDVALYGPESVATRLFWSCHALTNVSLPTAQTIIGNNSFEECFNLISVNMPEAKTIGLSAFQACTNLTTLDATAVEYIGPTAFAGCGALAEIALPAAINISASAFMGCPSLTNVSLPAAKNIYEGAFTGSGIVDLSLPIVENIGNSAFSDNFALTGISCPRAINIGITAFAGCTNLTECFLPAAERIGNDAFDYCQAITSLDLPKAESIGTAAFLNCFGLTNVSLPATRVIEENVFSGCTNLTTLSLLSATSLMALCFDFCSALNSVTFSGSPPTLGDGNIYGASPSVTNYITNPSATGWDETFGGQSVVRMPLHVSAINVAGTLAIDGLPAISVTNYFDVGGVPYAGTNIFRNGLLIFTTP